MLFYQFLSFWFRLCCGLSSVGRPLAFPFFRICRPSCWVLRRGRFGRSWWRRWPSRSCGRPSASSGFCGRWSCLPSSSLPALRRSAFVWFVCPAVVSRRGGFVFSVWAFWSPSPLCGDAETDSEPPTMKPPYGGESGGKAAAVAAVSSNLYQEVILMRNYKEAYISELIAKRAKEKAERCGGTFANEGATRGTVPFTEWLYYTEGIVRWTELSRYQLWNYYLDYRVDCVRNGMMFQCGEIYGLTNV